jgi:spore coat protein U-like protein
MIGGRNQKLIMLLWLLIGSLFIAESALAARRCTLTVNPTNFGNYIPGTPVPLDATGRISVRCRGNPSNSQPNYYVLRIDGGTTGNPANREMRQGVNLLAYNLFKDAARTSIWGDGTNGTTPVAQAITQRNFTINHTVYGRAYANQDPRIGAFQDVVTVTIEF